MGFRPLLCSIVGLLAIVHTSYGHYTFVRLAVNDQWLPPMQYIRNKTAPYLELPRNDTNYYWRGWNAPTYAGTDRPESSRCGRDHMAWAAQTDVLKVRAGEDKLELAMQRWEPVNWKSEHFENCPDGYGTCDQYGMSYNHHGPLMVHLSPVPRGKDVREYDGSGEWVKILTVGVEVRQDDPAHWIMYNRGGLPPRFSFKIPAQTPPGQYLMRMDAIYLGFQDVIAGNLVTSEQQLYPSCAQIEVVGSGEESNTSSFPKGIRIPEDIIDGTPGMPFVSLDMYRQATIDPGYHYPGGPLWDGEKLVQDRPDLTVKPAKGMSRLE
ncbi:glycosyl hydrolase family 61 domain containing protein [Naviculisporaceae sp. PSN 640]